MTKLDTILKDWEMRGNVVAFLPAKFKEYAEYCCEEQKKICVNNAYYDFMKTKVVSSIEVNRLVRLALKGDEEDRDRLWDFIDSIMKQNLILNKKLYTISKIINNEKK